MFDSSSQIALMVIGIFKLQDIIDRFRNNTVIIIISKTYIISIPISDRTQKSVVVFIGIGDQGDLRMMQRNTTCWALQGVKER